MNQTLTIYYTSDTHGNLFPDGGNLKRGSMMQCFHEFQKDENTLVLDGGDTIQGSPLIRFLREKGTFCQVIPESFNRAGLDYFTLGNHDFNYGYEEMEGFLNAMNATCVAANVRDLKGSLPLQDFVVHTLGNGIRVGICGIVTDCVNLWESEENMEYLAVDDAFEAAKRTLEAMKDQADVTICIYHGGFECDLDTGKRLMEGKENVGYRICRELDFDLLLTAHQHMETPGRDLFGTYTLQVPANAMKYAKVELTNCDGRWEIASSLCVPKEGVSQAQMEGFLEVQKEQEEWQKQVIGTLSQPIPPRELLERAVNGSELADFGNMVQLYESGADIACFGLSNDSVGLEREVELGSILRAFPFPNKLVVLEVSEAVLKQALERCASYFDLQDGKLVISERFTRPKEEHYNYDFYAGLTYKADISRPVGQRVTEILVHGEPLNGRTCRLAMSDYRATGTGGYEVFRTCPMVKVCPGDMQQSVISYLKEHPNAKVTERKKSLIMECNCL